MIKVPLKFEYLSMEIYFSVSLLRKIEHIRTFKEDTLK